MYLYIYEGFQGGPERQKKTEKLINTVLDSFEAEKGISFEGVSREIFRTEKGKPYFRNIPVDFSISHTDDLWVCLISDGNGPVGVDIQKKKETRQQRVAERYFTDDEKLEMKAGGKDEFFRIWTRKEAYAKFTGKGLSRELSQISTLNNNDVYFMDFEIRTGVKGACCIKEKEELCLRMI